MSLLIRGARVVTLARGPLPRRGGAMRDLAVLPRADVLVSDGLISKVDHGLPDPPDGEIIEARGRVLMPGLIDCHTHACFAGSRLDEWERKLAGESYLDILKAGGGIMATVRATRAASQLELAELLVQRVRRMTALGSTTIEVKSGYGLSTAEELKMLRAIHAARPHVAATLVPTALIAHAIDPDVPRTRFVETTIRETLPAVAAEFPGITIDAYCEEGAWTLDECGRLFEEARRLGCPCRAHADQFNRLGAIARADAWNLRSVDHLEASAPADLAVLAATGTVGVMLPCAGLHTDRRFADGRALIDAGGALAVATNFNPGSAPCPSLPMAMAMSVRLNGLRPHESITAATVNAAAALGLSDRGRIEPGLRADLVLLRHSDERELVHEFGDNPVDAVICAGRLIQPG